MSVLPICSSTDTYDVLKFKEQYENGDLIECSTDTYDVLKYDNRDDIVEFVREFN